MRLVPSRSSRTGFTLTELIVVVMLIGMFAAIMLSEMSGAYEDAVLHATARDLMAALSLASSRAVALNEAHLVRLDPEKNLIVIAAKEKRRDAEGERPFVEERRFDARIRMEVRDLAEPAETAAERGELEPLQPLERNGITFHPDGTSERREIVLRDRTGVEMRLRINPVTGRARVLEEAP
jgi:type II secretion system protein H